MHTNSSIPNELGQNQEKFLASLDPENCWVFAYGSLLWRPEFDAEKSIPFTLMGWHRDFCVYSIHYRGTKDKPGLVLGLDQSGKCHGLALKVPTDSCHQIMTKLWAREMRTGIYIPAVFAIHIKGEPCNLYSFIANRDHALYAGDLSQEKVIAILKHAEGDKGSNRDYALNTYHALHQHGFDDAMLAAIIKNLMD